MKTDVSLAFIPDPVAAIAANELPDHAPVGLILLHPVGGFARALEGDGFSCGIGVESIRVHGLFGTERSGGKKHENENAHTHKLPKAGRFDQRFIDPRTMSRPAGP